MRINVVFCCCLVVVVLSVDVNSHTVQDGLIEHVHHKSGARWYSKPPNTVNRSGRSQPKPCAYFESAEEKSQRPTISLKNGISNDEIPKAFDSRTKWSYCPTVKTIRDQAKCGSCWALASVEAMSDRICIHRSTWIKTFSVSLSAIDLTSCCSRCGHGCNGGWPAKAWDYWKSEGLKSEDCKPYPWPKCSHYYHSEHYKSCGTVRHETPKCTNQCKDLITANTTYKGISSYNLPSDTEEIQLEIMTNGPVVASFEVYEDFPSYHTGIYFHAWGRRVGGHAVKVLGWGEDEGAPYWLVANSWNEDWGESGYFRILRDLNGCGLEDHVTAGMPDDRDYNMSDMPPNEVHHSRSNQ